MSAFEKLPQEIRDLIYDHCLIYHKCIVPFPNLEERNLVKLNGHEPGRLWVGRVDQNIRSSRGNKRYTADWPKFALLGVNKTVQ